jgi:subtilisin family serine protease
VSLLIYVVIEFDTGRAVWGTNTVGDGKDYDCYGHGTHVAGIVAGTNVGVAKDVTVVAVKALDCTGSGTAGTVSQGIAWVISDCPSGTSCIISLSLGGVRPHNDTTHTTRHTLTAHTHTL